MMRAALKVSTWKVPLLPALLIQMSTEPIWEAAALIRRCTLAGLLTSHSMPAIHARPPTCRCQDAVRPCKTQRRAKGPAMHSTLMA